ncbi:MAG: Cof-type HAD-IIB family hydrolase [Atopobiaceae bacterium]|nr:Cof-type HAD-IIB family hydrolase [Atopobiaceae bacterium]
MAYKLLALDMDGTLLDSRKHVLPRTRDALQQLAQTGVPIAYCTGRCVSELMDYPTELPFIRYGVLSSGAVLYDFARGEALELHALRADDVLRAMELANEEYCMMHAMSLTTSVVQTGALELMDSVGMGIYVPMFEQIATQVEDFAAWIGAHDGEVVKINFYHRTPQSRDCTRKRIEEAGLPLALANAEETSVECSAQGISKAEGLRALASLLSIDMADVVAIGDSYNDVEALQAVGMPVAMGNAPDDIKAMARLVVADNDHDGIVEAIERLF